MRNRLLFHLHPILSLQLRPQVNLLLNKRKKEADPTNGNRSLPNQLQRIRISLHNLISSFVLERRDKFPTRTRIRAPADKQSPHNRICDLVCQSIKLIVEDRRRDRQSLDGAKILYECKYSRRAGIIGIVQIGLDDGKDTAEHEA